MTIGISDRLGMYKIYVNLPYLPFENNEAVLFCFAGFIFLVVPGRLQGTCVAAETSTSNQADFELHSVQLELEAVEKQIQDLVEKQAQLRERRAALETSRADAHKSGVSIQRAANTPTTSTPCVSLHRPRAPRTRSSQMSFTPAPGHHGPWVQQQRKTRARPRATTSPPPPPPVFEISTRFAPLRETERDAVIVGNSIIRPVHATLAEGKVRTHCFPGACVLDVSVQIPAILKDDESVAAVVIHTGVNDTKMRQTETLKRDFRSLIETVCSTSPTTTIIMSGPLPTYR